MLPSAIDEPTVSVDAVAEAFGISRASAYEAVRSGQIPSIRIGRRYVVPTASVRRMLQLDAPADPLRARQSQP